MAKNPQVNVKTLAKGIDPTLGWNGMGLLLVDWGKVGENLDKAILNSTGVSLKLFTFLCNYFVPQKSMQERKASNLKLEQEYFDNKKDGSPYITNQWDPIVGDMILGKAKVEGVGCENIAVFNAMRALQETEEEKLPTLSGIMEYNVDKKNIMALGYFGVNPYSIEKTLKMYGYEAQTYTKDYENITPQNTKAVIVSCWNSDKTIMDGIHTFALVEEDGKFVAYNAYPSTEGEKYESVEKFWEINKERGPILAITVEKKK